MQTNIKPIIVLGRRGGVFSRSDGTLETVSEGETLALKLEELGKDLRNNLRYNDALLEDAIVRNEDDLAKLKKEVTEADALLIYLIGMMPLQTIYQWGLPIVAFSGQYTPMLALYAFAVERHSYPNIAIAIDYQDIDEQIQLLEARKKLRNARIALLGFPPPLISRWHHLPDLELARGKLGVEFSPVEMREVMERLPMIDRGEAQTLAERWLEEAKEVIEPSTDDVTDAAQLYLALTSVLEQRRATDVSINCLELVNSLKAVPPCYPMSRLRDEGVHAACEADVVALLTMMLLGYLADEPAFMGNIVSADPRSNIIRLSHCVMPTRMAGFDQPTSPYILRNYHGSHGVTAHVELDSGREVTTARLARTLDEIVVLGGELVDCRDTTACRTTISVSVGDARKFVQCALGNHHAVVYGNHVKQVKALSQMLGIGTIEL